MAMHECLGCGGTYDDGLTRGASYFHVCAPEDLVEAQLASGAIVTLSLAAFAGLTLVPDAATRDRLVDAGASPDTLALERARTERRRAGHRNENTRRREGASGELRVLVREGAGARPRPDLDQAAERSRDAL